MDDHAVVGGTEVGIDLRQSADVQSSEAGGTNQHGRELTVNVEFLENGETREIERREIFFGRIARNDLGAYRDGLETLWQNGNRTDHSVPGKLQVLQPQRQHLERGFEARCYDAKRFQGRGKERPIDGMAYIMVLSHRQVGKIRLGEIGHEERYVLCVLDVEGFQRWRDVARIEDFVVGVGGCTIEYDLLALRSPLVHETTGDLRRYDAHETRETSVDA